MKKYICTERPNLFEPNVYISMVVELEGDFSEEALYTAVETAYQKNESTMSRVVIDKNGMAFYENIQKSGCTIFNDNREFKLIIPESEKRPFEINKGELVRTYIGKSNNKFTLLIIAHHLAGDGMGMKFFVRSVLRELAGEKNCYQKMNLIDPMELERKMRITLPIRWYITHVNRLWKKKGKIFGWDDYYNIHKKYWEKHTSSIEIEKYNKEEILKMKSYCETGITLNSYLVTLLAKRNPKSKVFGIPISIRKGDTSLSNQTSGISIKYTYRSKKSFQYNLLRIHEKIKRNLIDPNRRYFILWYMSAFDPSLIDAVLLESQGCYSNKISQKLAKSMGYLHKKYTDVGITNLTTIDLPDEYSDFKVKNIYFIPPKVSYARQIRGISTFHDQMTIIQHNISKKE